MSREDLSKYSNEENYQRPPRLTLNEVNIHGGKGKFTKTIFTEPKGEDNKYKTEDLGEEVKVVFLKVRRKMHEWQKGRGLVRNTTEHNHPSDMVMMYGDGGPKKGIASDIRNEFDDLRTVQVVYALLQDGKGGELVRVNVKGASLGSENKAEDTVSFYDYLQSFGKDQHFYEFITILTPVSEESSLGEYYAINFKRGDALTDKQMDVVAEKMKMVHEHTTEVDAFYSKGSEKDVKKADPEGRDDGLETIEYPEEDINPEDIPF